MSLFDRCAAFLPGLWFLLSSAGCGTPVVKVAAFDTDVLKAAPLPAAFMRPAPHGEHLIQPALAWLSDIDPTDALVFTALRQAGGTTQYALVVACDPETDRLAILPLGNEQTPLGILSDRAARADLRQRVVQMRSGLEAGERANGLRVLSIREAIDKQLVASPIPVPRRIYAVAANFPSHLRYDLAIALSPTRRAALGVRRARVFLKYPATTAGGEVVEGSGRILGPFDPLSYPAEIRLPSPPDERSPARTATRLDYEVEVGAVIGRRLTAAGIADLSDRELMNAIAGYVLVSDSKARNPQVVDKLADDGTPTLRSPYAIGDVKLDRALGSWDRTTCRWWSYAASWVDATAIGPFFVAAPTEPGLPTRAVVSARSYAAPEVRDAPVPAGRDRDVLYLRQCALVSDDPAYSDGLIWSLPAIIRSILAERANALHFSDSPIELEPGDVICLGTPGGTVITSRPEAQVAFLRALLFWWRPRNFHDAFFGTDTGLYLRHGDEVFFWGAGLGYQHHVIRRAE